MSDEDKKKIYQEEKKRVIEWFRAIASGKLDEVKAVSTKLLESKHVDSIGSLFRDVKDGNGRSAIHFAANGGFMDVTKWIVEQDLSMASLVDETGETPLKLAILSNHADLAKYLVEQGAPVREVYNGVSAMQIASGYSTVDMLQYLVDHGGDVKRGTGGDIGSPLHWATCHNHSANVRFLLEHGADPNVENSSGSSPLLIACINTNATIIQLLLDAGADPTVSLPGGITALHIVSETGHLASVQPFIAHPLAKTLANTHTKDRFHRYPVEFAAESDSADVVELLLPLTTAFAGKSVSDMMKTERDRKQATKPSEPVKTIPEGPSQETLSKVNAAKKKGNEYFGQGKFEDALKYYSNAIEMNPKDHILYSNRAAAHLSLNHYTEALVDADTCIQLCETWPKGHYRKGMVYFSQNQFVDAATAFYRGCELVPANKELKDMFAKSIELGKEQHTKENSAPAE